MKTINNKVYIRDYLIGIKLKWYSLNKLDEFPFDLSLFIMSMKMNH
jgi:hypothetical protein